jgi:hypothetical protein
MDVDFTYIVAISPRDGSTYRIHGFGLAESLAEFQRLMTSLRMQVSSPDQAESVAEFYRKVNPENQEGLTPILSLLELKQAAERQCQTVPFDPIEKKFNAWWKHAKSLYAQISFEQTATPPLPMPKAAQKTRTLKPASGSTKKSPLDAEGSPHSYKEHPNRHS